MNHYLRLVEQPMHPRFHFRKSRSTDTPDAGTVQVILSFPVHKQKAREYGPYTTSIDVVRSVWDNRKALRPSPEIRDLNRKMAAFQNALEEAHAYLSLLQKQGENIIIDGDTVIEAMHRLKLGDIAPISLQEVYHQFYAWKKSVLEPNRRIRKPGQISEGTLLTYPKRWALIQQFLLFQKRGKLPVQSVTYRFATELKEWLQVQNQSRRKKSGYDPVTIHKVIGLLKMVLTYAKSKEYIKVNPLHDFKTEGASKPNPRPLSVAQMDHLEACDLPPMLRYQLDSWLVAAELCFHYADFMELPTMYFTKSEDGDDIVQHNRVKQTGNDLVQTVNITPRAARILAKYGGPKGLYYTTSAYFSKILKKVARLADLRDKDGEIMDLQFGQGRDTGLTMRVRQGATTPQLKEIAGWNSMSQAKNYIGDRVGIVGDFAKRVNNDNQ